MHTPVRRRGRTPLAMIAIIGLLASVLAVPAVAAGHLVQHDALVEHVEGPSPTGTNHAAFWVAYGATNFGETWICEKTDVGGNTNFTLTEEPPSGFVWRALIVKQSTTNYVFLDPAVGATFNTGGAFSHTILCRIEAPVTPESVIDVTKTAAGSWDRTVSWELDKSVAPASHTGGPGDTFDSDWTVTATKSEVEDNYEVTGTIEISFANNSASNVSFTVDDVLDDGTIASVNCPTLTMPAGTTDVITCTYTAAPDDADAEENTATVTLQENLPEDFILDEVLSDLSDTKDIVWTENLIGDDEVTLGDEKFDYSEVISSSTTEVFPEEFECPAIDSGLYVDGEYSFTEENTATLVGDNTNLEASAEVTVTCLLVFQGESATGAGTPWTELGLPSRGRGAAPNTWFEVSHLDELVDTVEIITGRQREHAGNITATVDGAEVSFEFELFDPWLLDPDGNVKIHPMSCSPDAYVAPGQYTYSFDSIAEAEAATFPIADCYAIHLDIGYWTSG